MAATTTAKMLDHLRVSLYEYDLAKLEADLTGWIDQAFPTDAGDAASLAKLQTVLTLAVSILYDVALDRVTTAAGPRCGRGLTTQIFIDSLEQSGWKRR